MTFSPGDKLDRFTLIELLGEGGQGSVWKAADALKPMETFALKLIHNTGALTGIERIRREAHALARLSHPSLVKCHLLFEVPKDGVIGLVLDHAQGLPLDDACTDPRFTAPLREAVLGHIASALAYLHQSGLVHRDIKLENLILTDAFWENPRDPSGVKLVDFGIVDQSGDSHLTEAGKIIGTSAYLAPELIDPSHWGQGVAAPATRDVFAFGVLGWILMLGTHPSGLSAQSTLVDYAQAYRHAHAEPRAWPTGAVEGPWGRVLRKCLAVDARSRPQSGAEIIAALGDATMVDRTEPNPLPPTVTQTQPTPIPIVATVPQSPKTGVVGSPGRPFAASTTQPTAVPLTASAPGPASRKWLWIAVALMILGVGGVLVAGTTAVWWFGLRQPSVSSTQPSPDYTSPREKRPAPTRTQPAPAFPQGCSDCSWPQTACIDGRCRLAPEARWRLRPQRLVLAKGMLPRVARFGTGKVQLCSKTSLSSGWACMRAKPWNLATAGETTTFYFTPDEGNVGAVTITSEALSTTGVQLKVLFEGIELEQPNGVHQTVLAGRLLFEGGIAYRFKDKLIVDVNFDFDPEN